VINKHHQSPVRDDEVTGSYFNFVL